MIIINALEENEIPAAIELILETWMATYSGFLSPGTIERVSSLWHNPRLLNKQIVNPDVRFLAARDGGAIVGLSTVIRRTDGGIVIGRFYVHPSSQGRGIGKELFERSISAFGGATLARVEVDERNERALAFFGKRGFVKTGEREEDFEGTKLSLHILEKKL